MHSHSPRGFPCEHHETQQKSRSVITNASNAVTGRHHSGPTRRKQSHTDIRIEGGRETLAHIHAFPVHSCLPVRHAHGKGALVVLLVDLEHVLGRCRRGVREERHQERHVVHGLDMVAYCGDPVWKSSLWRQQPYSQHQKGGGAPVRQPAAARKAQQERAISMLRADGKFSC